MINFKYDGLNFCEYLPDGFDENKKYPLVMFLHGAGERGNDRDKYFVHGPLSQVKKGIQHPFIIIAPQCPSDTTWYDHGDALDRLFEEYKSNDFVDKSKIYVTGISMGGYGTWAFAMSHASELAAIIPICGGGMTWNIETLKDLPVWAFHCEGDPIVDVSESEKMVKALTDASAIEVKFTVYPYNHHDAWTSTYNKPEVYDWMLSKVKK